VFGQLADAVERQVEVLQQRQLRQPLLQFGQAAVGSVEVAKVDQSFDAL